MSLLSFIGLIIVSFACFNSSRKTESISASPASPRPAPDNGEVETSETGISGPNARELCVRPASAPSNPQTLEDIILTINALPKPVSVACLVDVLPRPLYVHATSNPLSGQPAVSASIPRIFVFIGPSLTANIVPGGEGSKAIEFGFRLDSIVSVKGEIEFPVTENLPLTAAYNTVLSEGRDGTECEICHGQEQNVSSISPLAFSSRINRPDPAYNVSLEDLEALNAGCAKEKKDECPIIQAIFSQGQVLSREFL